MSPETELTPTELLQAPLVEPGATALEIARAAARAAANEILYSHQFQQALNDKINQAMERVGIDTSDADKTRRDMVNLREWNEFWDFARKKGIGTAITWVVTGALASLAVGLGVLLGRH